ncbi:MAG TPA: VWA domain-containing protein, partial [Agitococcus sp.]|nr:VWA domain-containing protein [Agitococcus sp.]
IAQATKVANFEWLDLKADGLTDMGKALKMVAEQLKMPPMAERALPPVLVLLSDGQPTDNFEEGLQALLDLPWGKKAVKIAIAIGEDADTDVLQQFMGSNSELKPLIAKNAEQLVNYIKWASTAVLKAASSPVSQTVALPQGVNVPVPAPPTANISSADDVW